MRHPTKDKASKKYSQYKSEEELTKEVEVVEVKHQKTNLIIEPDGTYTFYIIRNEDGYEIPDVLGGRYTTRELARKAIKDYSKDQTVLFSIREEDYVKKRIAEEQKRKHKEQEANRKEIDQAAIDAFMLENGIITADKPEG